MADTFHPRPGRLPLIDALRGVALVAMVVYHFSWDLAYHGFVDWDVAGSPAWRGFAMSIAASFLLLVGVGLPLAARGGLDPGKFARRVLKIAAAAVLVSIVTRFVFPDAWIFFGILHMIAVGSVLGLVFLNLPAVVTLVVAIVVLVLPWLVGGGVFDAPWLAFVGLSSNKPISNDFVPILPWLAAILVGIAAGRAIAAGAVPIPADRPRGPAGRALVVLGRWTLPIYLIHQPLLFGLVWAAAAVLPANPAVERQRFVEACEASCGLDGPSCAEFCGCVASSLEGTAFFDTRGGDPSMSAMVSTAAMACRPGDTPLK